MKFCRFRVQVVNFHGPSAVRLAGRYALGAHPGDAKVMRDPKLRLLAGENVAAGSVRLPLIRPGSRSPPQLRGRAP